MEVYIVVTEKSGAWDVRGVWRTLRKAQLEVERLEECGCSGARIFRRLLRVAR